MATFGATIGSGGIRFYDADHTIAYNYVQGVYGGNYQGPLLLDTGDAEGSSTNLSGHWRVVGAMVERNVLVNNPEGVRIGDNYSSTPRDCTIRDNVVVDADTGAAITQRIAPSNTVMTNNVYYASTAAAGMTFGADGIWRKPGFGPRLTYLGLADVGPVGDLGDTDGTGAELGGGGPVAVPADVLRIGTEDEDNHFLLQYAENGASATATASLAKLAAGFAVDPYFKVVTRTIDGVVTPVVHFQVRADSATTSGSTEPRSELRETRADGSEMVFDALQGNHTLHTRVRITHLPAADPEVVVAQLHNGVTGDRIAIRTQLVSGETKLVCRINGVQADPRLDESYVVGDEFEVEIRVRDGGLVEVYYQGSTTPIVTGQLEPSGAGASWYWKLGAYAAFNETTVSATEYVSVEHRDLWVTHGGFRVDAGPDLSVVRGQPVTIDALEVGLTGISARRWTIVSRPTPPDPGPGPGPTPDLTQAAVRHGWGTPHALSDEFDYEGTPNSTKWKLPGADWAGHSGNGRRRPERQTVTGGKFIMTGLQNGDSGWCQHRLDVQYGRWEARVRSFAGAPSAGEPDSTSNGNDYHPLLLLWPQSNSRQTDGEYDWMENGAPGESTLEAFIHYPHPNTSVVQQEHFERPNSNLSQFHNIAMEWTSQHIKGFFDGIEWFSVSGGANSVRRDIQTMPAGHAVLQLDNFDGTNQTPATMELEWFHYFPL